MNAELPSFRRPPVIETAISVQFRPIAGFTNGHLGLFWQAVRNEFPKACDADPIANHTELFGNQVHRRARLPSFRLMAGTAASRLQMSSQDERSMLQLQNGRLIFNWRRMADGEYPRWGSVLSRFESALTVLRTMVAAEGLPGIEADQWEVAYVNHLERGRDWNQPNDWPMLLPGLVGQVSNVKAGVVESVGCGVHFGLPEDCGRLHIELNHGFSGMDEDAKEVLVLQLTARGGLGSSQIEQLATFLEVGHGAIVRSFCDVTGRDAHVRWERER